jgi:hypothetical protein
VSSVAQAKRHARGRRSRARAFDALTDFDCVREHALDTFYPGDQVARSGWVGLLRQICFDLLAGGDHVALYRCFRPATYQGEYPR